MNNDFDILINGSPMPALVQLPGDTSTTVKATLVARDGVGSKGTPWSIDTEGCLLPIDAVRGQLDAVGRASLTIGPSGMLGSVLRGNMTLNVKVGSHHKTLNLLFY